MKLIRCFLAVAAITLFSCTLITEIKVFKRTIEHKYNLDKQNVAVSVDNDILVVAFINTSYKDSSKEVKERVAGEIGQMAPQYIKSAHIKGGKLKIEKKMGTTIVNVSVSDDFDMGIGNTQ